MNLVTVVQASLRYLVGFEVVVNRGITICFATLPREHHRQIIVLEGTVRPCVAATPRILTHKVARTARRDQLLVICRIEP